SHGNSGLKAIVLKAESLRSCSESKKVALFHHPAALLPTAGVLHVFPGAHWFFGCAFLQKLNGLIVRRFYERHVAVSGGAQDGDSSLKEALTRSINIIDLKRKMAEIPSKCVFLSRSPVVGEFNFRLSRRCC